MSKKEEEFTGVGNTDGIIDESVNITEDVKDKGKGEDDLI